METPHPPTRCHQINRNAKMGSQRSIVRAVGISQFLSTLVELPSGRVAGFAFPATGVRERREGARAGTEKSTRIRRPGRPANAGG